MSFRSSITKFSSLWYKSLSYFYMFQNLFSVIHLCAHVCTYTFSCISKCRCICGSIHEESRSQLIAFSGAIKVSIWGTLPRDLWITSLLERLTSKPQKNHLSPAPYHGIANTPAFSTSLCGFWVANPYLSTCFPSILLRAISW